MVVEVSQGSPVAGDDIETSQQRSQACEDSPVMETGDPETLQNNAEEDTGSSLHVDHEREVRDARDENMTHQHSSGNNLISCSYTIPSNKNLPSRKLLKEERILLSFIHTHYDL